jgi:hypothetical protein
LRKVRRRVRKTKLILADFRNLLPRRSFVQSFGRFFNSIIESNKLSNSATLSSSYNNIKRLTGFILYGYMLHNYDEISVTHTEYIGTLLGLYFNGLKSFLDKLLVALGDGIQASRARCHLKEKQNLENNTLRSSKSLQTT